MPSSAAVYSMCQYIIGKLLAIFLFFFLDIQSRLFRAGSGGIKEDRNPASQGSIFAKKKNLKLAG
jgi:hypothetical protein